MINLIGGLVLVAVGLLLGKYPFLLSSLNQLSTSEKQKYDSKGLAQMLRNSWILLGLLVILIYPAFTYFEIKAHILPAAFGLVVVGIFIISLRVSSYKKTRR